MIHETQMQRFVLMIFFVTWVSSGIISAQKEQIFSKVNVSFMYSLMVHLKYENLYFTFKDTVCVFW